MGSSGHPLVRDQDGAAFVLPAPEVDELPFLVSQEARLPRPFSEPGDVSAHYPAPPRLTPATGEGLLLLTRALVTDLRSLALRVGVTFMALEVGVSCLIQKCDIIIKYLTLLVVPNG